MLNGKFYTGLPPKMSERRNSGSAEIKNRQESHFFWPDDTKTESAVETKVRRRTSLLLDAKEKPRVEKRLSTAAVDNNNSSSNEVDTRQRFHKEFANSSIQFFDNLQEEQSSKPAAARKAPGLVGGMRKQREVTPKLTSPTENKNIFCHVEPVVDENYTNAKRKQAYTSKIQFYDYMNEDGASTMGNNTRKPKMLVDMNDKREMEKNTKNSPKLQVKRNVRNMSLERELAAAAAAGKGGNFSRLEKPLNKSASNIYELAKAEEKAHHVSPPVKDLVPLGYGRPNRQIVPKKILKRTVPTYPRYFSEYVVDEGPHHHDDHHHQHMDYVAHGLRELRLRPSHSAAQPKKHVTYSEDTHYDYYEQPPPSRPLRHQIRSYYDNVHAAADDDVYIVHDHDHDHDDHYDAHYNKRPGRPLPNMRNTTGNGNHQQQQQQQRQLTMRIRNEPESPVSSQYMETGNEYADEGFTKLNNQTNHSGSNNSNNNNSTLTSRKISREATTRATNALQSNNNNNNSNNKVETTLAPSDPRKHLRSSLCFNGDALVVDTANSNTKTPTGSSNVRRNVRSSATQRVSVGLPD